MKKRIEGSKKQVCPKNLDITVCFCGSSFRDPTKEVIAYRIVLMSIRNNNQWTEFTWEEYCESCDEKPRFWEKAVLNLFVKEGLLSKSEDKYIIEDKFVSTLWNFVN